MSDFEKLFSQIKQLSTAITKENYYNYGKQGYDILIRMQDLGIIKGMQSTYPNFFFDE